MGKRKVYIRSDISIPHVEHNPGKEGSTLIRPQTFPPLITRVHFGRNPVSVRSFDFARWYGKGIDSITYACQTQIERFLAGQDAEIEVSTIVSCCCRGLRFFFDYLLLQKDALGRDVTLEDINRELIDGFISYLVALRVTATTQKSCYAHTKCVLQALGRRELFTLIAFGDSATFPRNPYPNTCRRQSGELPLPKQQRQAFTAAVKQASMPIWCDDVPLTSELLAYALLIVALHTGRNTTPLLEMGRNCLQPHPKDGYTFLTLWKRRGHNTSKVVLRAESSHERLLESSPIIKSNVERLIRHIIARTESLRIEAPSDLQARVWLYRSRRTEGLGEVLALSVRTLEKAILRLVAKYKLIDSDGKPLRLNISRLRKTFANRVFELLDGDLITTAIAMGNSPEVTDHNYMSANEDAKRNWRFMGKVLVEELLSGTIGATYHQSPTGHCTDPENGEYAPKKEGATCINFLNCVRCRHYVVTGEDLYKLFSFYFRIFSERARMDKRRWARDYAHIPRLIDDYIVVEGLRRGVFKLSDVETAREHARTDPHPFWSSDLVQDLDVFT
ncbi:hypothetical protein SAMN04489798_0264 [Pseudomonas arsenicoxydans]|uniref:Core-binding (CB) domain-containing protein n=1 Tax=Pseudomonas arsenicoxydans TaxID=702115 RepID=A0A1H0B9T4_9PSED|nr:hypothetical protein [Pseudomonas arsenicoxydans]SDN42123.1 hypothetical protein SAMN04489798_0264 [Pseudomonas arsenicoxydans]